MKRNTGKFWEKVSLEEMNRTQWESLCDGCGRCCLRKILFEDTRELVYTNVVCRYLDDQTCRCVSYKKRKSLNAECLVFSPENIYELCDMLPDTCAYRLVLEGRDLSEWHPLISGDPHSVHEAGVSIRGKVVSEEGISSDELEDYIVDWIRH